MRTRTRLIPWLGALLAVAACSQRRDTTYKVKADEPVVADSEAGVEPGDDLDPAVATGIGDLFQSIVNQRHPPGTTNVKRAVFLKPHGCARGTFTIPDDLPETYRQGLFATPGTHTAWVRVSSDTVPSTSDLNDNTIGFAVKVLNVPGTKVLAGEEQATTHDFLTQNHPEFFVDTAQDFLAFTQAALTGQFDQYMNDHPVTKATLDAMKKQVPNALGSTYWSTTPYRFGTDGYAKYKVIPCAAIPTEPAPAADDKNYVRKRLERDVLAADHCFDLQVQLRHGDEMPLDRASVVWSETVSPPQTVARINIPAQDIKLNTATCENLSYTAWHALPEHRPVGSINKARGYVYKHLGDIRRTRNNVPLVEPE